VKVMLATGNKDKVRELEALLAGTQVTAAPDGFDPDETGTTLVQNARIKAEALRPDAPGDAWVMADDSGLFVHALDGRPGVYSSRYAGPDATYADHRTLAEMTRDEKAAISHRGRAARCMSRLLGIS
jgi:XTP/dITP diphosphohydrolase